MTFRRIENSAVSEPSDLRVPGPHLRGPEPAGHPPRSSPEADKISYRLYGSGDEWGDIIIIYMPTKSRSGPLHLIRGEGEGGTAPPSEFLVGVIMYVNNFSIKNQQKIVSGFDELNFHNVSKWFSKFAHKENTIVKVQLSSIDIEKVFNNSLFFKNELTVENNCVYEELILEDIIDWNIFIPYQVSPLMLGHPIVLKRKLMYDDLHISVYCFRGTLKAMKLLLENNNLRWSSKNNRTPSENKIISSMKYKRDINYFIAKDALVENHDYEIIGRIFNTETMELLLKDDEVPFKELINQRLISFTESQDQNPETYLDDYNW